MTYQDKVMNTLCRKKDKKTLKLDRYVTGRGNICELCEIKKKFMPSLPGKHRNYL